MDVIIAAVVGFLGFLIGRSTLSKENRELVKNFMLYQCLPEDVKRWINSSQMLPPRIRVYNRSTAILASRVASQLHKAGAGIAPTEEEASLVIDINGLHHPKEFGTLKSGDAIGTLVISGNGGSTIYSASGCRVNLPEEVGIESASAVRHVVAALRGPAISKLLNAAGEEQ